MIIISINFDKLTLESSNIIRGYSLNENSEFKFLEDFKIILKKRKQLKTFCIECENDIRIYILNEYNERSLMDLYKFSYNQLEIQPTIVDTIKPSSINLESYVSRSNNLLENPCEITLKEYYIVLCLESLILIIDTQTQRILKHEIDNNKNTINYFLSPTNISLKSYKNLKSIDKTNNFVAIDNLNNLNYIKYSKSMNSLEVIASSNFNFTSYRIKKNLLIAYDSKYEKLKCYNLNKILDDSNKIFFNNPVFTVNVKNEGILF